MHAHSNYDLERYDPGPLYAHEALESLRYAHSTDTMPSSEIRPGCCEFCGCPLDERHWCSLSQVRVKEEVKVRILE